MKENLARFFNRFFTDISTEMFREISRTNFQKRREKYLKFQKPREDDCRRRVSSEIRTTPVP